MKDVVVVGATGFTGSYLLPALAGRTDCQVRALVHKNPLIGSLNVVSIYGDLLKAETLAELCPANSTVVNLAYKMDRPRQENISAINNLLAVCVKARIKRFIHCSTVSVFGRFSSNIVTEATKCNPVAEYEFTKLQIEQLVLDAAINNFEATILRPAVIFGPRGNNLVKLAADASSRSSVVNYLKACVCSLRRMNLVSVHNVVASIDLLIDTASKIDREVFIVSDDYSCNNNYAFVEAFLRNAFGLSKYSFPVLPIPSFVLNGVLRLEGKSNYNSSCVYSSRKLEELGYNRAVSFENALAEFVQWVKMNPGI